QSDDGRWHQVIDESDSFLEFTSTCMISYALLYAVRSGLLEESQTRPAITRAWAAIERCIGTDGLTIESACESTGKLPNLQAYLDRKASSGRDDRGGAMALIFAESLLRTPPAAG
ncbi:MAG: glycoside hydrolase family 88 protein, partial [Verrucomicrobiota bacterium]